MRKRTASLFALALVFTFIPVGTTSTPPFALQAASALCVVSPDGDWVRSDGLWTPGATVSLTVEDGSGVVYADSQTVGGSGGFDFDLGGGVFDLQRGHVVTVSDGTTTKTHTVTNLFVDGVDVTADTVFGRADPGTGVDVWVDGGGVVVVTADGSGNWVADFSGSYDLTFSSTGGSEQVDADGDTTKVDWDALGSGFPSLGCNSGAVEFETGIPVDWTIVDNAGGTGIVWTTTTDPACAIPNRTNGTGEAACADSDAAGTPATPYDTELVSNPFDLSGWGGAVLDVKGYYRDITTGANDRFEIDVWNGSAWTTELSWDDDHEPEDVALNLSAYAGSPNVQVRFRYFGNGFDWYAQIDDVALTCVPPGPPVVGVTPASVNWSQGADIVTTLPYDPDLTPGFMVISNSGGSPLNWSIVEDDTACDSPTDIPWLSVAPDSGTTIPLGYTTIDVTLDSTGLAPGSYAANLCVNSNDPITPTVLLPVNFTVESPETLLCNGDPITFEDGIPLGWAVVDNTGGTGIVWTTTADPACEIPNRTNGSGEAACADSDAAGFPAVPYDTELISPPFDLSGWGSAFLDVKGYYRDLNTGSNDRFEVDLWNGSGWVNGLSWDEDHEPEDSGVNLSGYTGLSTVQVRFRYFGNGFDWYAQVDDIGLTCTLPGIELTKTATPGIINEPGDTVTYTFETLNTLSEAVTLDSLVDTVLGDLDGQGDCALPQTIPAGGSYTCSVPVFVSGNVGDSLTNLATATASDGSGVPYSDSDDATVLIQDVAPAISVLKTVDQTEVFAPGDTVTFTVVVSNESVASDPVMITSLEDTVHGNLDGVGTCALPLLIPAGGSETCWFSVWVDGDETNSVTVSGYDDEGNVAVASDDATVVMVDPAIDIEKSVVGFDADAAPGPEILAGESVTWTYMVTNEGDVDFDTVEVTDPTWALANGLPAGQVLCSISPLAVGESYSCNLSGTAEAGQYANTATGTGYFTDADGDLAVRTDSDDSHYFGADPSVSIVKTTADGFGNSGDGVGILPGQTVSWSYVVVNDGNVELTSIAVNDDQLGLICTVGSMEPGDPPVTCTATGTAGAGPYTNTGTASSDYTDDDGNAVTVSESDGSSYFGLPGGLLADSSLCDLGDSFILVFAPDIQAGVNRYRLADSNPGQFFYNLFDVASGPVTIEVPYPFVSQGANPVHVYAGVLVDPMTSPCLLPTRPLATIGDTWTLDDFTDTNGDGQAGPGDFYPLTVDGLASGQFTFINLHLDYGLEKTDGWKKKGDDAVNDPAVNPDLSGVTIPHLFDYEFASSITNSGDTVAGYNNFKRIRGVGGFVRYQTTGDPANGVTVEIFTPGGTPLDSAVTDQDGWYYFTNFQHKGKQTSYTVAVDSETETVTLGGKTKYQRVDFTITP